MDKYEYKLRLEEIKSLNRKGRFQEAAQVADGIDWKKVRNVSTLGIISDVYKVNRRFEDAKAILLLANEQSPQNRRILYSLCDLTIKMGQVVEALEYYKEFVQLSPNDNNKYILLYKIYEAQDISLDERIAVLKEYKKREYNEKWAYELAFLYHRVGLATECVEECDQLILWFGEGKYVAKAMELKMRYVPLSPAQQQAYERIFGRRPMEQQEVPPDTEDAEDIEETDTALEPAADAQEEMPADGELDIQVKTMDMGKYNTMNLQAALAESMREVLEPVDAGAEEYGGDNAEYQEDITRIQEASAVWDAQATGQLEEEMQEADGQQEIAESGDPTERSGMDAFFGQEYDGQISMALQEGRVAEKQITGQMSIEDVLAEWEALKKQNEEKRREETRRRMLQQTGSMFEDFDQNSRDGVLERLQREESLPVEEVQKRYVRETFPPSKADNVERTEPGSASITDFASGQPVRPMPANAAARVVMAAQGAVETAVAGVQKIPADKGMVEGTPMEEITGGGTPVTNIPASTDAGAQLSDAEQKRLSIEALMREAEEKQREARELLMQLERERQLAAQQAAGMPPGQNVAEQPQSVQYGENVAGQPQSVQYAENVAGQPQSVQYGENVAGQPQSVQYGENVAGQPQQAQYAENVAGQPQSVQYGENVAGQLQQVQYAENVAGQPQSVQYAENMTEQPGQESIGQSQAAQFAQQPQAAQYVQGVPGQPQGVQYAQGMPGQPQDVQYVQGMPGQPQDVPYAQGMPGQPQDVQYVQGMPGQPQDVQYAQGMPGQPQDVQYAQGMPGQLQNAQYVQSMPGQPQSTQYGQGMPGQPQGVQNVQGMPGQLQGAQYVQGMPEQPQDAQYAQQLQTAQYVQGMPGQPQSAQYAQQPQSTQYAQGMPGQLQPAQLIQNPAEQAQQPVQDTAEPQTEQDMGSTQELIRDKQLEEHERSMTQDEKDLFSPFVPTKGAMRQLIKALDSLSLSAYTGNMIITGAPGSDMIKLAKSVVKIMRVRDRNFSGQIAKINGDVLNSRSAVEVVSKIPNGALIIEKGGKLSNKGAVELANALNQEQTGLIVFLLDSKRAIASLMEKNPLLASCFTARFDIEAMDTAMLVKYGCQYAYNMEYAIDEMGRLALHTRIEDMQTKNHAVTVEEVREIIEEAIAHAERFSVTHFTDILFRRRYDDDDMVILKERDFI